MSELSVTALSKVRGYDDIFTDVSFSLSSGELLWLKGANGTGKTSLMRILAGLSAASRGELNSDIESVHYVSHQLNLIDSLSVEETLKQLFPLCGINQDLNLADALRLAGLGGTQALRVSQLSAGQKQRLNLLTLALDGRELWLLDEPYSNLDKAGRTWLNGLLTEHLANKGLAIVISHDESLGVAATQELILDA